MAPVSFKASAPGSLMLLGEHAVLQGQPALVCAVNRRIHVTLAPRKDRAIRITSALGRYSASVDRIKPSKNFRFVVAAVRRFARELTTGFDLRIDSEFSHKIGFGSSAAVTVATLAALSKWLNGSVNPRKLLPDAVAVIRETQGLGSGADVAASVHGGIVLYRANPIRAQKLNASYPLTVLYSGSKMPTVEVVGIVERARKACPELYEAIFKIMGRSSRQAAAAIRRNNWKDVGAILNLNRLLMAAIGVSNGKLAAMACLLLRDPAILGAKISGSGLGDCVIGLGRSRRTKWPFEALPVMISPRGVQ